MQEFYPVEQDITDQLLGAAVKAIELHWRHYNSVPTAERLGDEEVWDERLPEILIDTGIEPDKARELCEIGKLEASLYL